MFENSTGNIKTEFDSITETSQTKDLLQKINELFDYRMFPRLMQLINKAGDEKNIFYNRLISLQSAIYHLDAQLEKNWFIDENERASSWADIWAGLSPLVDVETNPEEYTGHIRKYEKHEMAIRQNVWPTRYSMTYFYFYKSCDVKLLRRLIYEYGNLEHTLGSTAKWRHFDFITEINDDISDLYEDMPLYNGNRFLLHLMRDGKKETEKVYTSFIDEIESKAEANVGKASRGTIDEVLHKETVTQCQATRLKMQEVLAGANLDILLKESALAGHLMP